MKKENASLQDSLNSDRYDLEQRTLDKVDLKNRIQTLIEDSDFKNRMDEKVGYRIQSKFYVWLAIITLFIMTSLQGLPSLSNE